MNIFKRLLTVLVVLLSVAGCKTYDQSFDWVEGSDIEGVSVTFNTVRRGIIEFAFTNNGSMDQTVVILPQSSIIGYKTYLSNTTGKAKNSGTFKGEPHVVQARGRSMISNGANPNIYGSFILTYNDFVVAPGETIYTQMSLRNLERATENFISKVFILVREGDVRNRIVIRIPAGQFFDNSVSVDGSAIMLNTSASMSNSK